MTETESAAYIHFKNIVDAYESILITGDWGVGKTYLFWIPYTKDA